MIDFIIRNSTLVRKFIALYREESEILERIRYSVANDRGQKVEEIFLIFTRLFMMRKSDKWRQFLSFKNFRTNIEL